MSKTGIQELIDKSSIPAKENLIYIFATAIDIIYQDVENDIQYIRQLIKNPELKLNRKQEQSFKKYIMLSKQATLLFHESFDKDMDTHLSSWREKDFLKQDANDIIRLILLFVDRSCRNEDNKNAIFKFIRSCESCGELSEKEVERFQFKL